MTNHLENVIGPLESNHFRSSMAFRYYVCIQEILNQNYDYKSVLLPQSFPPIWGHQI